MPALPEIPPYPMPGGRDLPGNTARWTVDPERAILLVHDMQHYFLRPFAGELFHALIGNIVLLRERCAELEIPVAFTAQPGRMTARQRGLLADFWGPGMRMDPMDRTIVGELAPRAGDQVFTKWRYSAFFRSGLLEWMSARGRDQIIICGVYAHVGILMTAVDAFSNDIESFLVADAVADFSAEYHRLAIEYAAQRCAVVTTARGLPSKAGSLVPRDTQNPATGAAV